MQIEIVKGRKWRVLVDEIIDMERDACVLGPFERMRLLERAPEKVRRQLELANRYPGIVAASSPFASVVGVASAAPSSFTAVNTTTTETNLWVPSIWSPIPAGDMQAGKLYEQKSGGVLGTTATPTLTFTPRIGQSVTPGSNITMGASTGVTMTAALAAVPWFSQFGFTIRALGLAASGATGTGNGFVVIGDLTTTSGKMISIGGAVATTIDNTAATGYVLSATWGTNNVANTIQAQYVTPVYSYN